MPKLSTLKSLSSVFRSSINSTPATTTTSAAAAAAAPALDKSIKHLISSLGASSASTPKLVSISVDTSYCSDSEDPTRPVCHNTPSILSVDLLDSLDSKWDNGGRKSIHRKLSRERKQRWAFKKSQVNRVNRLVDSCAVWFGIVGTLNFFGKLGREIGMKEFNRLLKICIENASTTDDETVALEHVSKAFEVFMSMKEQGFPIEEDSYGEVLLYLIDRGMVEQFHLFTDVIKDGSASTLERLGYYEMLLYTRVNDEEKAQEFCNCIFTSDGDETISLRDVVSRAVVDEVTADAYKVPEIPETGKR